MMLYLLPKTFSYDFALDSHSSVETPYWGGRNHGWLSNYNFPSSPYFYFSFKKNLGV
jgi:hypothetical protein